MRTTPEGVVLGGQRMRLPAKAGLTDLSEARSSATASLAHAIRSRRASRTTSSSKTSVATGCVGPPARNLARISEFVTKHLLLLEEYKKRKEMSNRRVPDGNRTRIAAATERSFTTKLQAPYKNLRIVQ